MTKYLSLITVILLIGCAGTPRKKSSNWADEKLADMTVEQKIGQMMAIGYVPRFYNQNNPQFLRLMNLVNNHHIGGVMFYRGMPYEVARSIERLQAEAKTPLLIMADMEWGLPMRVDQATDFLQNMAIGAAGSEEFAYAMGKITATEAKAIGVHVGYAPVMDVNNNPDNIIINTRSYGEDPEQVSRLGAAFIRGMQEQGVFTTAKHFPGHGDLQITNLWQKSKRVKEFVMGKRLASISAELMGTKGVQLYHDQALYKEPDGGFTPWHADQYYWPLATEKTCTVWIPLQETIREMGPLSFSAKSQNFAFGRDLEISDDSEAQIHQALSERGLKHITEPFDLGEVSYHYGWTFHKAGPNISPDPRKVMTIIYMDKDVLLKEPSNENQEIDRQAFCSSVNIGEVIDSPLNPILYSE